MKLQTATAAEIKGLLAKLEARYEKNPSWELRQGISACYTEMDSRKNFKKV